MQNKTNASYLLTAKHYLKVVGFLSPFIYLHIWI